MFCLYSVYYTNKIYKFWRGPKLGGPISVFAPKGVTRGGTILRAPNQYGGLVSLRGTPKSPNNVTSTSFNTVHLLPKDLRFEHGGAKLASCPGRHLTSLRPCSCPHVKYLSEVLCCAVWVVVPANKLSLPKINQSELSCWRQIF